MPTSEPEDRRPEPDLPGPVVLGVALLLTVLLGLWSAFLVPLRVGGVPAPLWLVPFAAMLAVAGWAGRRAGPAGVLLPAVLWLGTSWFALAGVKAEGDLVLPGNPSGYAYLLGGAVLWVVVVARSTTASPAGGARR